MVSSGQCRIKASDDYSDYGMQVSRGSIVDRTGEVEHPMEDSTDYLTSSEQRDDDRDSAEIRRSYIEKEDALVRRRFPAEFRCFQNVTSSKG